jgi:hypothetical protein
VQRRSTNLQQKHRQQDNITSACLQQFSGHCHLRQLPQLLQTTAFQATQASWSRKSTSAPCSTRGLAAPMLADDWSGRHLREPQQHWGSGQDARQPCCNKCRCVTAAVTTPKASADLLCASGFGYLSFSPVDNVSNIHHTSVVAYTTPHLTCCAPVSLATSDSVSSVFPQRSSCKALALYDRSPGDHAPDI